MNKWLIIDFDSTINKLEALDELAKIVDTRNGNTEISEQIKAITDLGMKGEISFPESLKKRMDLLSFNREEMNILIKLLRENFTDSFLKNIQKLEEISDNLIIISGGFKDFIVPALSDYKIKPENIYANEFIFNEDGNCIGFIHTNLLANNQGKVKVVEALKLKGEIIIIGDGYTDYQIRELGAAHKFIAFIENVEREKVTMNADFIAKSFDDIFNYLSEESDRI